MRTSPENAGEQVVRQVESVEDGESDGVAEETRERPSDASILGNVVSEVANPVRIIWEIPPLKLRVVADGDNLHLG